MESSVNASPENLIEQVVRVLEYVGVHASGAESQTVDHNLYFLGSEIRGNEVGNSICDARMRRGYSG